MLDLVDRDIAGGRFRAAATERADGDLHPLRVPVTTRHERQRSLIGRRWVMAEQVHGADVWRVADPVDTGPCADVWRVAEPADTGPCADVVVADDPAVAIGVWSADCATLLLVTDRQRVVGVHAGWRGLAQGVLDVAIAEARCEGHAIVAAVRGPVIGPCCYEFGDAERAAVVRGAGVDASVGRTTTRSGAPALDVGAVVGAVLDRHGLALDAAAPGCTGCDGRWWSHRVGVDVERQVLVGWWS